MAIKSIQYKEHIFDMSYEILNPQAKIDIIILHGWGSNKEIMRGSFAPFMDNFRHIYIDLPGFGNSTSPMALTTNDVARVVELFMMHINASRDIIVGHSFGGKVALLLQPQLLVLLSTAGIYREKSLKIKSKIILFKLLKIFGFSKLRSKFVADDAKNLSEHMYETFKNVVNEDFAKRFANYSGKALLCWGREDTATPLSSGEKIEALMDDARLEVYEGDHFFFTKNAKDISSQIEKSFVESMEA